MPLERSTSKEAVGRNVSELMSTGKYPQKQAVAIALSEQRRAKGEPAYDGRYRAKEREPK